MKNSGEMRVFLISMFVNMIVTYLIGFKYKTPLIELVSSAVYYQFVVFLSLLLPHAIRYVDRRCRLYLLQRGIDKLKKDMDETKISRLDKNTVKMYEKLIDSEVKVSESIKKMHDELEHYKNGV